MDKQRSRRTTIPANIPESLGKLPPQALDIEKTVLGQALLETSAYPKVKDILEPEYFYPEQHQLIFSAIASLGHADEPINIRTVVHRLRKDGNLDKAGGASYLAELISLVSSVTQIEYHSRILIEYHIKRELIRMGANLHAMSYDDTSDAPDLLHQSMEKLRDLHERVFKHSGPNKIKQLWETTLLTTEPDEPPPIIYFHGVPVSWPGGHSLVVGKKKSRKTLFMVWMVSSYLSFTRSSGEDVLFFDTEQSKRHAYSIRKKVFKLTNREIAVFYLRGKSPEERLEFIRETVRYWPTPPQLIVIDGIRDLQYDILDSKESMTVLTAVEGLTVMQREDQKFPPHVINVLHLNKGDDNPRGHLGTELQNKADCTILLELDEKSGCTDVRCESSREGAFSPFSFTHDADHLPQIVTTTQTGEALVTDDRKNRLKMSFEDGPLKYSQMVENIKSNFAVGVNKAKQLVQEFRRRGWIVKSGDSHSTDTVYKLMITDNGLPDYTPPPTAEYQPDLFIQSANSSDDDDLPF